MALVWLRPGLQTSSLSLIVVSSNERQINDNGQRGAGPTAKKLMATAISCLGPLASGIGKNTSKDTDNIRGLLAEAGKS
jgi:hypothetical protein